MRVVPSKSGGKITTSPTSGTCTTADLFARIELHHGTTHTLLGVKRSLDDARRFAERHLAREYPSASPLIFRSQAMKWMERAATPAQRDELSRLLAGVDRQVVSRLKRGVASALLTYLKQRSAGRAA
jgi:hypothetical protein